MGNYRFKFSDMMSNAWFYKLRFMGKKKNQITHDSHKKKQPSSSSTTQPSKPKEFHQFNSRKSYYFTRELDIPKVSDSNSHDQPRKSSRQTPNRRTRMTKSYSPPDHSSSPFESSAESKFPEPEFRTDHVLPTEAFHQTASWPSNTNDIIIDVNNTSIARKDEKINGNDSFSEFELPLITTKKKETKPRGRMSTREEPNKQSTAHIGRSSVSSPGVKLRTNSPRIASRKIQIQTRGRKSVSSSTTTSSGSRRRLSDTLAIVKSSWNPQRDFRESMVEMIVEHNIRGSKDLEDLLACYLYLNSDEYHELIIEVFKQIWFDLTNAG